MYNLNIYQQTQYLMLNTLYHHTDVSYIGETYFDELISKEYITGHIQSCPCNELQVMSKYHTYEP